MSLRVEQVLGHASIQGGSAVGKRKFGVPPGGAFDPQIQEWLNMALGNPPEMAILELAMCRLTLTTSEAILIAWSALSEVILNGKPTPKLAGAHPVPAGSELVLDIPKQGARTWLAVAGGFLSPLACLLKRGDILQLGTAKPSAMPMAIPPQGEPQGMGPLRGMPGRPEFRRLFQNRYTVRHDSNRVGIRLDGPRMAHHLELPSEPATPGVVQITPEGLPIILGPDGPTIGGYPRAAVVISADIRALAQLRPGAEVRFEELA